MTRMSRSSRRLASVGLVWLACAATQARAQTPAPTPTPTPAPSPSPEPPKIDVSGFVDTYYGYNFNKVDPIARTFDVYHNTFSL
ncbi:MAG TPA: hypothetical protein VMK12_09255, partial [Anaeromyxobacteraceae bacterium]|nr:hypothetical protein [Anaeromyxobacteraceae bacterium]